MAQTFNQFLKENIKAASPEQVALLDSVLSQEGKKMESDLLASRFVDEPQLAKLKADYFHIPYLPFDKIDVDESVHELIPPSIIKAYHIIPFEKVGNKVKIAISDPTNLQVLEALEFLAKKNNWEVELHLVTESDLNLLMQKSVGVAAEVKQALQEFTEGEPEKARVKI